MGRKPQIPSRERVRTLKIEDRSLSGIRNADLVAQRATRVIHMNDVASISAREGYSAALKQMSPAMQEGRTYRRPGDGATQRDFP